MAFLIAVGSVGQASAMAFWSDSGIGGSAGTEIWPALVPIWPLSDLINLIEGQTLRVTPARLPSFGQKFYALDHGNPEINRFAIDHFSRIISEFGVDVFRQDGTAGWPADTGPDRSGISQIRYMEGFYEFWDGLLERNPNLLIDNCATGARRVELETMKRSISLHRSDAQAIAIFDALTTQAFNQGLFPWVPLHGGAVPLATRSAYSFRSAYCPALLIGWPDEGLPPRTWITDVAKRWSKIDLDLLRRLMKEYLKVRPYIFGDYYPLTPYSLDTKVWAGWQFDRPDLGEGMVQMFRRQDSADGSMHVKLRGLEPLATYTLTDLDAAGSESRTGRRLMDKGLTIAIKARPGSAIFTYHKKLTWWTSTASTFRPFMSEPLTVASETLRFTSLPFR